MRYNTLTHRLLIHKMLAGCKSVNAVLVTDREPLREDVWLALQWASLRWAAYTTTEIYV